MQSFNGVLLVMDLMDGDGLSWSLYILLFFCIGLGLDAWNSLQIPEEDYEIAIQKWYH